MNVQRWFRQSHRGLSIVFTTTVIANFVVRALGPGEPSPWLTYSPLPPLLLQMLTGLYLLAHPCSTEQRSRPCG